MGLDLIGVKQIAGGWHMFFSIVIGYCLYMLLLWIFCQIMWLTMSMEVLGNHDYSFLLDDEKNQHIIVAVGIFEKFDYVTMKNYMFEKCSLTNKCSSKLVKKFGFFWYK